MNWQNRIVGEGEESPDQLLANPFNARLHPPFQQDSMKAALDKVGWVQRVIVNRTTGHVVDGHLRIDLAMRHHMESVPVEYVELTESEELLVLATYDYITVQAAYGRNELDALLNRVNTDSTELQSLLAKLAGENNLYEDWETYLKDKGEFDERMAWPYIRIQVSPATLAQWNDVMKGLDGNDDNEKLARLLTIYADTE